MNSILEVTRVGQHGALQIAICMSFFHDIIVVFLGGRRHVRLWRVDVVLWVACDVRHIVRSNAPPVLTSDVDLLRRLDIVRRRLC
jgi:hypothetical protein